MKRGRNKKQILIAVIVAIAGFFRAVYVIFTLF